MARPRVMERPAAGWVALALLVLVSTGLRAWAARRVAVPWIAPDEMIYGLLGLSLYQHGTLEILGGPTPFYTALAPVFTGWPLSVGGLSFGYGLLRVVQALTMSLAAVPVYAWTRSLGARGQALAAAALTLALPGLVYSGLVMTEVLFYPLLVLAAWAMAAAFVRPTPRAQALLVAAALAAAAVRLQALILLPAFAGALVLHAVLARSTRTARALLPSLVAMSALAAAWFGWRLAAGSPLLGGYAGVNEASYGAGEAAKFVAFHAAAALVLTGVFPVCALAVLLVGGLFRGEPSEPVRAYLAVAGSLLLFLVVEVGVFASQHVDRLAERDLLALAPIVFVGFAVWLRRGGPRPYALTAAIALGAAAVLLTLPVKRFFVDAAAPDAPTLIPFVRLLHLTSTGAVELAFFLGAGVAVLVFVLLPQRLVGWLPALLLLLAGAASVSASTYVADQSQAQQTRFLGPDPRWVDRSTHGATAYVYDGEPDWTGVWETIFFNRRIDRVLDLPGALVPGPLPQRPVSIEADGRLAPAGAVRYAVASTAFALRGHEVGRIAQVGIQQAGLVLWRVDPPLRLATATTGILANGDVSSTAAELIAYDCRAGDFLLTLLVKQAQTITIERNGVLWRRLRFPSPPSGQVWRGRVPAVPRNGVCTLQVKPTGLLGTTVFTFERRGRS